MGLKRVAVMDGGSVAGFAGPASGFLANVLPTVIATDANATLTAAQISAGALVFTGFTAGRNLTVPTAAQLLAVFGDMNIGDSITIAVSCVAAFAGTWVAATGVTLRGRATVPASSWSMVVIVRTGAATFDWIAF